MTSNEQQMIEDIRLAKLIAQVANKAAEWLREFPDWQPNTDPETDLEGAALHVAMAVRGQSGAD